MKPTARKTSYTNATSFKLPNRRVTVCRKPEGFVIQWLIADDIDKPHAVHTRIKGKITSTTRALSNEGAECLMLALMEQLKKGK